MRGLIWNQIAVYPALDNQEQLFRNALAWLRLGVLKRLAEMKLFVYLMYIFSTISDIHS